MKRAVIFLLVLLIAVSGLCYAVDRAVRAQLAETIRQIQSDKHTSLASWEYDSISRRIVLRDVQYAAPENGLTVTARELQAVISLRAILHAAPQLDFLLSSQGYLTLLDDWQGTDVTLRQSLPEGEENDCTVARVEGSALAVAVEQFKRLRDASTDAAFLRDCAFRSLRLEKPAFARRGGQQTPIRLEAGTLELEKAKIYEQLMGELDFGGLFMTVLWERAGTLCLGFLISLTSISGVLFSAAAVYLGFSTAVFVSAMTMSTGIFAIFRYAGFIFPQCQT